MSNWTKYPAEERAATINWTTFLGDAEIDGEITAVWNMPSLTVDIVGTDENVSTLIIAGGTASRTATIVFTVPIAGAVTPWQAIKKIRIKPTSEPSL